VGESDHTFDTLAGDGQFEKKREAAVALIRDMLANGPVDSEVVLAACVQAGISRRTAFRARKEMGVVAEKTGFGAEGSWSWRLPNQPAKSAKVDGAAKSANPSSENPPANTNSPKSATPILGTLRESETSEPAKSAKYSGGTLCRDGLPHVPNNPIPGNSPRCARCGKAL
jgi:hypothetical protein